MFIIYCTECNIFLSINIRTSNFRNIQIQLFMILRIQCDTLKGRITEISLIKWFLNLRKSIWKEKFHNIKANFNLYNAFIMSKNFLMKRLLQVIFYYFTESFSLKTRLQSIDILRQLNTWYANLSIAINLFYISSIAIVFYAM